MQRAMALATIADAHPGVTAADLARQYLDGRHRSVASILVRTGRLAHAALADPTLRITREILAADALTWAWMQRTVRVGMPTELFAAAVREARGAGRGRQVQAGGMPTTVVADGLTSHTHLYDTANLAADPERVVVEWERWIALRTQELAKALEAHRPRNQALHAAASVGSLFSIQRALAAAASPAPTTGPHSTAIRRLEALAVAVRDHRLSVGQSTTTAPLPA